MMNDCTMKKIEQIVTKSISRFGRNTVDTLDAINKLHAIGVDVYFQNEGLNSLNGDNSFMISIIEAIDQEENAQRSENIRWGILKRANAGKGKIFQRKCFGYTHDQDGHLSIEKTEADIVLDIFAWYLSGHSILSIRKELQKREVKSPNGRSAWSKRTLETMLKNEKYVGDVSVMKTYTEKYPKGKRKVNQGEFDRFTLEQSHPAIIPKDVFEKVQAIQLERSNVVQGESGSTRKNTRYSMKKAKHIASESADNPSTLD